MMAMMSILLIFAATVAASPPAIAPPACSVLHDVDVNPHTPGLGHVAAATIADCCAICRSQAWWARGCRFGTLSRGACWLKADNKTVVRAPGKMSVGCGSQAPPPPLPPPLPPKGNTGPWEKLGPWNIGDDVEGNGEAGTLADAVSPASNPLLMYAGGQNNGASSGVLKSVDGGRHWVVKGRGMFNTRIEGLHLVDGTGRHLYCGVIGAIYESHDGGDHWALVPGSDQFGTCNTFKNGTIGGEPHVLAGCSVGIANIPMRLALMDPASRPASHSKWPAGWNVIGPGGTSRSYFSISDSDAANSVVGTCLHHVWIGKVVNQTYAEWTQFPEQPCTMLCLDPNDASHFIYTKPPVTRQSWDGGLTHESLNHSNIWSCGIDRRGWLYTAAMGGAYFAEPCGRGIACRWRRYNSFRVQRRTNRTVMRTTHDYQRIALDFGATGVAFPSDQGLFVKPAGNSTTFVSANGNLSNNIAMKVAVSAGEGPDARYLVTTAWDWAPLASWDGGKHWPSWQPPLDGGSAACIGEGGGAYAMGRSNHTLVMHRHNILHSSMGGKNLSRFVPPHRPTVFGPAYARRAGSRTEPNGAVYAPLFMRPMPWSQTHDRRIACNASEARADLGAHTNFSCLAAADLGVAYGWYRDVNYAVWRGDSDRHCHLCRVGGNASSWRYVEAAGAWSYALSSASAEKDRRQLMLELDSDGDGRIDAHDLRATQELPPRDDDNDDNGGDGDGDESDDDSKDDSIDDGSDGRSDDIDEDGDDFNPLGKLRARSTWRFADNGMGLVYIAKNFQYGSGNWTWSLLSPHLQGKGIWSFVTDPTDGGRAVYAVGQQCIARSLDHGDSWEPCWKVASEGIKALVIKDTQTMIIQRSADVPLRTKDGGASWHPLVSCSRIASSVHSLVWSWSGRTLALFGNGGEQSTGHPHTAYVWRSGDDGDTWTDETAGIVTMGAGVGQWYEDKLYLNSAGEGIMVKVFE